MKAGLLYLLCSVTAAAGHGYHHHGYHHHGHPKCTKEIEIVTKNFCRLEFEKSCTTETKTFFKITGFEDKDCKEVEICKHGHGEDISKGKVCNRSVQEYHACMPMVFMCGYN